MSEFTGQADRPAGFEKTGLQESHLEKPITVLMIGALPVDLDLVKGGVEAVIMNLISGFRERSDVRVVHVAHTKEVSTPKVVQIAENVVIHFLPFLSKYELADYALNQQSLRNLVSQENPDIIHIQEITPHLLRFLKSRKERIVVTQHGIMHEELKYASGFGQTLKCLFKAGVERYIFPLFRHIIFISRYNQKLYRHGLVHGVQIFNPVNPIFFEATPAMEQEKNTLVYVGVLSRRKNVRIIIEALGRLKKSNKVFKLHVIGGFKDKGYESEILSLVKDLDLRDQIVFHGWMKQEEIRRIYRTCPIFVLPSLQETLPVSIGEAMAQGKVVVASDVGAINEMFTDKISGFLFPKNSVEDLVKVLESLFNHEGLGAMGARAREEAVQKFHPAEIAKRTLEFYREVIEQNKAKAG